MFVNQENLQIGALRNVWDTNKKRRCTAPKVLATPMLNNINLESHEAFLDDDLDVVEGIDEGVSIL